MEGHSLLTLESSEKSLGVGPQPGLADGHKNIK